MKTTSSASISSTMQLPKNRVNGRSQRIRSFAVFILAAINHVDGFVSPHTRRQSLRPSKQALRAATSSYIATCIPGLSTVLAQELDQFGCRQIETTGESAVRFTADVATALRTLLHVRTAHKIMECLCQGSSLRNREDLAAFVREHVDVRDLLGDGKGGLLTISVNVKLNNPSHIPTDINHSHYSALCIKNALCDAVRELRGDRPNVELDDTDVPLTAVLVGNIGTETADISLYRQLHVGSLHRRGYRQRTAIHKAAMKESLAAGLLLHAKWDQRCQSNEKIVLMDPMAGSGTLLLEAAMIAANMAPGLMRIKCRLPGQSMPCIVRWKHAEEEAIVLDTWKQLLLEAADQAKRGFARLQDSDNIKLIGNEIHSGALDLCDHALDLSGLQSLIQLHEGNCCDWRPAIDDLSIQTASWFVVTNPPWGERLTDDMHEAWEDLRVFLRQTCPPGTEAWALSGNAAVTKHLGLSRSSSLSLKTGTQSLRWLQYSIREVGERKLGETSRANESDNNRLGANETEHRNIRLRHPPSKAKMPEKTKRSRAPHVTHRKSSGNDWLI